MISQVDNLYRITRHNDFIIRNLKDADDLDDKVWLIKQICSASKSDIRRTCFDAYKMNLAKLWKGGIEEGLAEEFERKGHEDYYFPLMTYHAAILDLSFNYDTQICNFGIPEENDTNFSYRLEHLFTKEELNWD